MNQQFYDLVYKNWTPKALTDKKYKMYESTKLVIDALIAMDDSIAQFITISSAPPQP